MKYSSDRSGGLLLVAALSLCLLSSGRSVAAVLLVNMVPKANSGETNQDSEPNLTVNPSNILNIAGSAFTPDPLGGANAPIYVSSDGGKTWFLNNIVPSEAGSGLGTGDITVGFSGTKDVLYAGILRNPGNLRLNILRSNNFLGNAPMTILVDRNNVDQPFVQAIRVPAGTAGAGKDRVFVGSNDFAAGGGKTATIDFSLDGASVTPPGFATLRIEARDTGGQDGPPIRPAIHKDGTVFGAFMSWRQFVNNLATADLVVVRDDNGGIPPAGSTPFTSLLDDDGLSGKRVITGVTIPFINQSQPDFGQERFTGSSISIAVDPTNSKYVYVAWCDGSNPADFAMHVRASKNKGVTWSADDVRTIPKATNPALAVNTDGTLGFLYQQLIGAGAQQRWVTHLERTNDDFRTANDLVLANVPANAPPFQFIPYIGDYEHVLAVGRDFYGIFSANNTPDQTNFPQGVRFNRNADFTTRQLLNVDGKTPVAVSIDPFFFRVTP